MQDMPVTTVDRPLTVKQTKFAAKVASGTPKAVAHREVYATTEKHHKSKAQGRKALEVAARPNVAAEIRRLTWLSCPPADDVRGMREHSIRVLSDLSRTAASEEVRLKSALALFRIAETTRAASDPRATDTEQDRVLGALRKLYREVQGATTGDGVGDLGPVPRAPDDEPIDIRAIAAASEPQEAGRAPREAEPQEPDEEPETADSE
jgi:hypothetical protein